MYLNSTLVIMMNLDENTKIAMPDIKEPDMEQYEDASIKLLNPKQQRFVHMYLSGQYTIHQIADLLNMSHYTLRNWLRKPDMRKAIDEYQTDEDQIVKQMLKATRLKALGKMSELIDCKIEGIAYQAARDVLDRTGHKAVDKKEVNVEIYTFEQQMKEVIKQSNAEKEFIDVEYEIVKELTED